MTQKIEPRPASMSESSFFLGGYVVQACGAGVAVFPLLAEEEEQFVLRRVPCLGNVDRATDAVAADANCEFR